MLALDTDEQTFHHDNADGQSQTGTQNKIGK